MRIPPTVSGDRRKLPREQFELARDAVHAARRRQAADLHPRWPLEQILNALTAAGHESSEPSANESFTDECG